MRARRCGAVAAAAATAAGRIPFPKRSTGVRSPANRIPFLPVSLLSKRLETHVFGSCPLPPYGSLWAL